MSFNEQQLEDRLRNAPAPQAPASLRKQLLSQVNLPPSEADLQRSVISLGFAGWLRRWWPALAPATISLACGVVMAVQRIEITDLQQSIQGFSQSAPVDGRVPQPTTPLNTRASDATTGEPDETTRLKERVKQLGGEITQLEQTRKENEGLRKQLATPSSLTAEEQVEMDAAMKARDRARRISCVNNLKQLGIAIRGWAIDHNDVFAPDIPSLKDEIPNPKILICPADTNRVATADWKVYTSANTSYEYLAANGSDTEPTRIAFRCPIHENIGLCDGSVQTATPENYSIIQRDGKSYLERKQ